MSEIAYNQSCRLLAISNNNTRLYRLKKDDLLKICNHYGVEIRKNPNGPSRTTATKNVLESRIIEHRDKMYEQDPESVVSPYNTDSESRRIEMLRLIREVISEYSFCFTNQSFLGCYAAKFNTQRIRRESKINLAIILVLLNRVDNDNDFRGHPARVANTEIFDIYFSDDFEHRNAYYEEIKLKVTSILNKTQNYNEEQRRRLDEQNKNIQLKNDTGKTLFIYWYYKRQDNPQFSECKLLRGSVLPGKTYGINYSNDDTRIITTTRECGYNTYYMDLNHNMVSDNLVTEKDPTTNLLVINGEIPKMHQWMEAALKCDYLLKELKRLGIEKYDNFEAIIDMHQDIVIPQHSERDKDCAGIPSVFTNVT